MTDGYPNFQWNLGNPITDGYENEDTIVKTADDESEYIHIKEVQEEILLEDKVEIHDPLEDKYLIQ